MLNVVPLLKPQRVDKFNSFDIRDAIGQMADGLEVNERLMPSIRAAVSGICETADRGTQIFVVGIAQSNLHNVDTEELIWPKNPADDPFDDLPLHTMLDANAWTSAMNQWLNEDPVAWTAFVWRIAVPLSNRLQLTEAWPIIHRNPDGAV